MLSRIFLCFEQKKSMLPIFLALSLAGAPYVMAVAYGAEHPQAYSSVYTGHVVHVPQGMVLPVTLKTSVSSGLSKPGDPVIAELNQDIVLGNGRLPKGSLLTGQLTESRAGERLGKSGLLSVKFTSIRTPLGAETPIYAHILGGIGKYSEIASDRSDIVKGETGGTKAKQAALRGAVGAGSGAVLGTALGAIAGRSGRATGRGAVYGLAIGAGLGVAESLLLRKGEDVIIPAGEQLSLHLDAPVTLAAGGFGNI